MFIDTHTHLNLDPFFKDPEPYVERALKAGVTRMIVPSIDIKTSERAIALADRFDCIYAAVGIHPHDSKEAPQNYISILEKFLQHPKVCAVGEIGMDYYRDYAPRNDQLRVFREQVELARSLEYPMIIHNRAANDDTYAVLESLAYFRAQFHCFGSDVAYAKRVLNKGALISFTGVVTFSKKVAALVEILPLERLMIETDSPWMAPVPYRGKQNEPAYVIEIAKSYAKIFQQPLEHIAATTTATAEEFFHLQTP